MQQFMDDEFYIKIFEQLHSEDNLSESFSISKYDSSIPKHIVDMFNECVDIAQEVCDNSRDFSDVDFSKLQFKAKENSTWLGLCSYDVSGASIYLNPYTFSDSDEEIKSTILHELAHFIDLDSALAKGYIIRTGNRFSVFRTYAKEIGQHRRRWRAISDALSNKTGIKISVRDESAGMRQETQNNAKYVITCSNCNSVLGWYQKYSKAIQTIINHPERCSCAKCHKRGTVRVTENK